MFNRIKYYYQKNLWTIDMVKIAVHKGIITKEQFENITNQKFE